MKTTIIAAAGFALALLLSPAQATDDAKADNEPSLVDVSLDVQALRACSSLRLTDEQLRLAAKLAKETSEPARKRKPPKVSEEYRKVLTNLRSAFLADDDDKIGDLEEELDQLMDKEKLDLDDSFEVTKAARKRTPEMIKSLTVGQLAGFYSAIADDVQEPVEQLTKGLSEVRGLEKKEWNDKRDGIADDVAWLVAGLDAAKSEKINDKVVALLSKAHALSDEEFKAKKADLEKEAKTLVGDVGPDTLLRHSAEHTVADLLSNPRLAAALKARLK